MKLNYADEKVSDREITIAVASVIIGIGVLSLPRDIASATKFADGWIVILIGGVIICFFTWLGARLAASFPHQSFLDYTTLITTKRIAVILTFIFSVIWMFSAAIQIRILADMSNEYLFEKTPPEVIALTFLLVVIYAISGPTVGLLRLNLLFLQFVLFISLFIVLFNLFKFDANNLLPVFKTDVKDLGKGIHASLFSYGGFSIVLFYISLVKKPKNTARKAAMGIMIPIALYILIYLSVISVFGQTVTKNILYPTVELAKTALIPGGFFERFESIFFVIWSMAIFNTTAMALDIAVITMNSIFKNMSKMNTILILTPIVYLISMFPINLLEVRTLGNYLININHMYAVFIIILLNIIVKVRRVKPS